MKSPHFDQHYLAAIRNNDTALLKKLVAECYPSVEGWICQNAGSEEDAKDVFADALEAICRKISADIDIPLTSKLSTFIFSICKNQWLKRLRRKKLEANVRIASPRVLTFDADSWDEALEESERMKFFREKFAALGESCRQLLELCWSNEQFSMSDVASALGLGSANYASKRKHECIEKLTKNIYKDPRFSELQVQ